jgi:hypothetical protein
LITPLVVVGSVVAYDAARTYCASPTRMWDHFVRRCLPHVLSIVFLAYPVVTHVAYEAFSCFDFEDGTRVLVADVSMTCEGEEHERAKAVAWIAVLIYPVGLLAFNASLLLVSRRDILAGHSSTLAEATTFLHGDYVRHFYAWELAEIFRRFLLVGLFVYGPYERGTMMQLALATLFCTLFLVVQIVAMPYRTTTDNFVGLACSLSLCILFLSCNYFKVSALIDTGDEQDGLLTSANQRSVYEVDSAALAIIIMASVLGALVVAAALLLMDFFVERRRRWAEARAATARRLRKVDDGSEVVLGAPVISSRRPPSFTPTYVMADILLHFHLFLSHVWGTGQDQARIVKQRLGEMLPDASVFLDVDDLSEGKGAEFVDVSSVTLVFCSEGYFQSPNCLRELVRAVATCKPIISLLELEAKHGGMTTQQIKAALEAADAPCEKNGTRYESKYAMWGLAAEVRSWGYEMPTAVQLYEAILQDPAIEWARIGAFQDVTLRLIAERLLEVQSSTSAGGHGEISLHVDGRLPRLTVYVQGELANQQPTLLPPAAAFHAYVSTYNPGALEVLREMAGALGATFDGTAAPEGKRRLPSNVLRVASDVGELPYCDHMILYLDALTWTRGDGQSAQLAAEVEQAMDWGVHVLLAHEMLGVGQEERQPCAFDDFFACDRGTTPPRLLRRNVYDQIAVPLKGGAWRQASMVMLVNTIVAGSAEAVARLSKDDELAWLQRLRAATPHLPALITRSLTRSLSKGPKALLEGKARSPSKPKPPALTLTSTASSSDSVSSDTPSREASAKPRVPHFSLRKRGQSKYVSATATATTAPTSQALVGDDDVRIVSASAPSATDDVQLYDVTCQVDTAD